jgi:hypothetical protein
MMKATATLPDGRQLLMIGLSNGNLDTFRAQPLDSMIRIDGRQIGLGIDVLLFSGRTEAEIAHAMSKMIGPHTKVHIDQKLKS